MPDKAVSSQPHIFQIFTLQAPVGRGKKDARSCFRSRRTQVPIFQEGDPRKTGVWGADDCERPLCEGAHRNQPPGHFWFLFGQTKRNPPRRVESSKNKSGSDGIRHSHRKTVLQGKRQSEALQEVLLPTFLSRKVGQHFSKMVATPWPPPMHRVARPFLASSRFCISCSRVTMIRAPEAPTG